MEAFMEYIIPCNENYYDVSGAMSNLKIVDWKQTNKNIEIGDIVYLYISKPTSAIKYKCKVNKVNLPFCEIDDTKYVKNGEVFERYGNYMEIEFLEDYQDGYCTIKKMRDIGTKGNIQSQRTAPKELVDYLDK